MDQETLKPLNLDPAKEEAKRENWTEAVKESAKEDEENNPLICKPSTLKYHPAPHRVMGDLWDHMERTHEDETKKNPINDPFSAIDVAPDVEDANDADSESNYLEKGTAAEMVQEGDLRLRVQEILQSQRSDLRVIDERRIQVDLKFLASDKDRIRVKSIVEGVIKAYSTIPGRIETSQTGENGVYIFSVTNNYISPDSDSSGSAPKPPPLPLRRTISKRSSNGAVFEELKEGIILKPRFPNMPECKIQYGKYGISESGIASASKISPKSTLWDLIKHVLIQTGNYKRIATLYILPKE